MPKPPDPKSPKDAWKQSPCFHPEHSPPTHFVVPPGTTYEHRCPGCGKTQTVHVPRVTL